MLHRTNKPKIEIPDRWWVGGAVALALLLSALQLGVPLWLLLLLPVCLLIFIMPGALLIQTCFTPQSLDLPARLLLMLLAGIATCILGGLFLYRTGSGFGAASWAIVFGTIAICVLMDRVLVRPTGNQTRPRPAQTLGFSLSQITLLATAFLIVSAAIVLTQLPSSPAGLQGYTQLWLHPCGNADQPLVLVGVDSREFAATTYRLDVQHGSNALVASSTIQLQAGEDWQAQIPLVGALAQAQTLDVFLYRADQPTQIYRHVALRRPTWLAEKRNEIANSHCQ